MINDVLISQVRSLSIAERIELIGVVWETLSLSEVPPCQQRKKFYWMPVWQIWSRILMIKVLGLRFRLVLSSNCFEFHGLCPPCGGG